MVILKRFDVCLVKLDPMVGSQIKKTRPAIVISPDSMNVSRLKTIIVAPMTSTLHEDFPTRVKVTFKSKKGEIALDQLRAIDRSRVVKNLGCISQQAQKDIVKLLEIMFLT